MRGRVLLAVAAALALDTFALADVWDVGTDNDNDSGSDNEIVHGLSQVHDVAAQSGGTVMDVDWFTFRFPSGRSFEILVDGITGDVSNGTTSPAVQLIASDGTTVDQDSEPVTSFGVARSLRAYSGLAPGAAPVYYSSFLRISNPACGLTCAANDQYRIRAFETTLTLPRFNNSGTQTTILILQNPTGKVVLGTAHAMSASGTVLGSLTFAVQPYGTYVATLSAVLGGVLNGQSGSLIISHNGPYGVLSGKGVALEPSTGFTFDTALSHVAN
jgi:hypothetical protein